MRYLLNVCLPILLCLSLTSAFAQEDTIREELDRRKRDFEKEKALGKLNNVRSGVIPKQWSIKKEVETIEKSLDSYNPLIESLEEANSDLKTDLANYLKNPNNKVLAAKITHKMSKYAKKIVWNVDKITSSQDVLLSVFTELNRKLNKFNRELEYKNNDLKEQVNRHKKEEKKLNNQLIRLSKQIKSTTDPKEKEKLTRTFRRTYRKFNINARYKQGLSRNQENYESLTKNLGSLVKMFSILHQSFSSLIENLEAEKNYLLDNIRLQADSLHVQRLVHEGITDGSRAVVNVTKKLATLYAQVEGFAKVHEKINRDMARFSDTSRILSAVVDELERAPFQANQPLNDAIDHFAEQEESDDEEENE
ncbi:hypothetical protein [Candidatus Uabimicrobium amorphum]|uniref:Uncharacterized protein n=1 Tax=Uabimicrobium amorphum TaxID=2596890 RepID=A0A5S9ILL0_UABAM|nr:hypothetical protein [Candidatus Uabimicrobium amorphum]BBM83591.1 hypothetical protein UABAM_01944 [Candidatus Uabimicrobium amorphum]